MPKVAVVMGSDSDFPLVKKALELFKGFNIEYDARVISAHRTPDIAHDFAKKAVENGYEVIIAAAGKAAHLAGVIASMTPLPVIGIPIKSSTLDGLDSLLSTVQMPQGIPVATVAIDGSYNAALLAIEILGIKYPELMKKVIAYKKKLAEEVIEKDKKLQGEIV
ncbi:phosphoribosylaminoimidazole carboxylase, catalytic subunit [Thermoanaerobacterium thermosaccharolyticum DSM 571]|jgi:5-(carboxyamino)imidazole ribonucleotide mutase|uniref:N5-carboxyaminoimidazole ribonucleotide mutase n=1 Tax=Thermoanaerobacterium thermosaccharolyticum (strain ATCC 7956 / DSM 571 / NCIMB 9385 / NCA 3814 / NCTC 13789 / WDCM 00135 / 2032) TaxID=580327 RepID=D9TR94_THETC|nr:5-(carboxyamino)imidazole ribonucleotide mutase [Thermoanaerobacterium thermosaccharolyticum]ADL69592.1 phosphoribosylaminoimidazole carboxylase, catalytic subunit [Thermoanaerobacterium thermosaccharolyticum DSM 571]MCP2239128.1 5-(carboxyamino)imidazole ribonucleotide mutase [Thermoanaerobacterium thermosaccharolyticum]